ncbi:MAG: hypothetical protein GTN40_03070 [Candidatus Aenigmarchaeota archaeon]|nr:hypothetical protein [Candidatus Aenigmarchaeota archaeon]
MTEVNMTCYYCNKKVATKTKNPDLASEALRLHKKGGCRRIKYKVNAEQQLVAA